MKKVLFAAALAATFGVFADGIESSNIVGYQTTTVKANDMTMIGPQFVDCVNATGLAIQNIQGNFLGGETMGDADNLYVWDKDNGYVVYYYGFWGDPENPDWDNLWYDGNDEATEEAIKPGQACWYVRKGESIDVTFAGQVFDSNVSIPVKANDMTMFCSPYPKALAIQDLPVANPVGGETMGDADNLYVWDATNGYVVYYFGFWGDPENPDWDNIWYDGNDEATEVEILPGQACWYVRKGVATSIAFTAN